MTDRREYPVVNSDLSSCSFCLFGSTKNDAILLAVDEAEYGDGGFGDVVVVIITKRRNIVAKKTKCASSDRRQNFSSQVVRQYRKQEYMCTLFVIYFVGFLYSTHPHSPIHTYLYSFLFLVLFLSFSLIKSTNFRRINQIRLPCCLRRLRRLLFSRCFRVLTNNIKHKHAGICSCCFCCCWSCQTGRQVSSSTFSQFNSSD